LAKSLKMLYCEWHIGRGKRIETFLGG